MNTDFNGEFGYELIGVIPYAYYLHKNNLLQETISCLDTQNLYYFSINHHEKYSKRVYRNLDDFPFRNLHRATIDKTEWIPPPYKEHFINNTIVYDKPICVISNKYTQEWAGKPINFLSPECINNIVKKLKNKYTIIYNHPKNYIRDSQEDYDFDYSLLSEEILFIEKVMEYHKLSYNLAQMLIYANCDKFISVQGGNSVLASYFGGENHIYAVAGDELTYNTYDSWYHELSGCKIKSYNNYEEIIDAV